MSNVNLIIAGRPTAVSCAAGEESHIEMLGRMIDERARRIGGAQSESRTLLFAALMLADELHDAHREAPATAASPPTSTPVSQSIEESAIERLVERVNQMAERVEKVRQALEQGPVSA
ncbi:cell division protein ZapA [Novosphingobium hassiacum]|uniref:Cell division protein ZapA n=1 Tax=Novosphingobium hassiacum TaxID=173676 RepID=A0A7W6EWS8_9SPHN|nr:cell division protein ZapA [Novosphingobium hassiacum]MBB3861154.1 cell division protein ZapA [Novosphingobium hassiacum]